MSHRRLEGIFERAADLTPEQIGHLVRSSEADDRLLALAVMQREVQQGHAHLTYLNAATNLLRDSDNDCRWQAAILLGLFIPTAPQSVWEAVEEHGHSDDDDMRAAIATVLLEHLIEHDATYRHFAEQAASRSPRFADTLRMCWASDNE